MKNNPSDSPLARRYLGKRVTNLQPEQVTDLIAAEAPLAIHVSHWLKDSCNTQDLAVTMRTPGADRELAAGLLLTEGVVHSPKEIECLRPLGVEPSDEILAELAKGVDFEAWRQSRHGFVGSSCGVCGKTSIEQIVHAAQPVSNHDLRIPATLLQTFPQALFARQQGFAQTGGLHAAALFSSDGNIHSVYEDIGRHNALDKLIGNALLADFLPLSRHIVFLSSRASFELIQKAAMAGVPILATVGAPSSLAIDAARQLGLTLVCFVREERFTVYSGDWRLDL